MEHPRPTIGRGAVITACNLLEHIKTNAELESVLLEYGISDHVPSRGSIAKTVLALKEFAANNLNHEVPTDVGAKPLALLLVELAIALVGWSSTREPLWDKLERYLDLDGFALIKEITNDWGGPSIKIVGIAIAMPRFAELAESLSEVDTLLARNSFVVAQRHLSSAKENIKQGDWEAANSQCRTFMEALTDAIADRLFCSESSSKSGGLQKRQLLADRGFLSRDKHEFGDGSRQTFLPGLAKLLHPDGAHPGISTQNDAMFRLQLVLVTARWLLKRLEDKINGSM
ncbi:hypothetical protein ACC785_10595 [Rhizobium ruizarguesonis]